MANLGNPGGSKKRRGRRIHRRSILDIKKNEKLLQVEWNRRYWDLFLCFFVVLYDILTPYRVGFFDRVRQVFCAAHDATAKDLLTSCALLRTTKGLSG